MTSNTTGLDASTGAVVPVLPEPRADAVVVTSGSSLFLWGGVNDAAATNNSVGSVGAASPLANVWRFSVPDGTWTRVYSAPAGGNSTAPATAAVSSGGNGAGVALTPTGLVTIGGAAASIPLPPVTSSTSAGTVAVPSCDRFDGSEHGKWVPRDGTVPAYRYRADEAYACEAPAMVTSTWDAAARVWARVHPEPDLFSVPQQASDDPPLAPCLGSSWCAVPPPRSWPAVAFAPHPVTSAPGDDDSDGGSSAAGGSLLLYGGAAAVSGRPTGDLWRLPLPAPGSAASLLPCDSWLALGGAQACAAGNASIPPPRVPCNAEVAALVAACAQPQR